MQNRSADATLSVYPQSDSHLFIFRNVVLISDYAQVIIPKTDGGTRGVQGNDGKYRNLFLDGFRVTVRNDVLSY